MEAFKYLAGSGCSEIAGTDDAANFLVVRNSLSRLGISDSQQVRILGGEVANPTASESGIATILHELAGSSMCVAARTVLMS